MSITLLLWCCIFGWYIRFVVVVVSFGLLLFGGVGWAAVRLLVFYSLLGGVVLFVARCCCSICCSALLFYLLLGAVVLFVARFCCFHFINVGWLFPFRKRWLVVSIS